MHSRSGSGGDVSDEEASLIARMLRRNQELDRLMRFQMHEDCNIETFARQTMLSAVKCLSVQCVSIWLFSEDRSKIEPLIFHDETGKRSSVIPAFCKADFPDFFDAIVSSRVIEAHDALNDPRTSEFRDSFLAPFEIYSILNAQIPTASGPTGLICCESIGERRQWLPDESSFLASIGELIGLAIEQEDKRKITAQLRDALEAAEHAKEVRSIFLANMSHEIRTPLNGVMGMAELLGNTNLNPVQKEKVDIILDSSATLLAIVNDVLDLSQVEAGKIRISPVVCNLREKVERTCKLFETRAHEKGLYLELEFAPDVDYRLRLDPIRVRQCLSNLLSNAVKFTHVGGIKVFVRQIGLDDEYEQIQIIVRDTGIGIAPDQQKLLFQDFVQLDESPTRRYGGTGLGLSITRRFARLMGGDVTVSGKADTGAEFILTFRAMRLGDEFRDHEEGAGPEPRHLPNLRGREILIVDDHKVNRTIVRTLLEAQKARVTEAENGSEALDKIQAGHYELVIMDVHMPVMDGRQALRYIRSSKEFYRDIPVIALTADALEEDRKKLFAIGMDGYVSKPIVPSDFFTEIYRVLDASDNF